MKRELTILDDIEHAIKRNVVFDCEEKYTATVLWIAGTYFPEHNGGIKVFSAFPMLGFMSPEPNSGKSTALEVTGLLSRNALSAGKYTTASLLAKIDQSDGEMITLCLDELDVTFSHGRDNAELVQLFNLGYKQNAVMVRLKRFGDGFLETPAFCPKVFSGLKIARIPGPTKTRSIIINMRPKAETEFTDRYIDEACLKETGRRIQEWSSTVTDALEAVDVADAAFLANRNQQIWEPLLAVAKVTNEYWYQRALKAAQLFTASQETANTLSHIILRNAYHIFRSGRHPERIHSVRLLEELHELGVPKWLELSHLADYLSGYDPEMKPRQMKIDGINRNGYDWHTFFKSFRTYISEKEVKEIEQDVGITPAVDKVEAVDARGGTREVKLFHDRSRETSLLSTGSTCPTF